MKKLIEVSQISSLFRKSSSRRITCETPTMIVVAGKLTMD